MQKARVKNMSEVLVLLRAMIKIYDNWKNEGSVWFSQQSEGYCN